MTYRKKVLEILESQKIVENVPLDIKKRYSGFQLDTITTIEKSRNAFKSGKLNDFINTITLIAGRRSGKTELCASLPGWLEDEFSEWNGNYTFASFDVKYLKQIYWQPIIKWLEFHKIKHHPDRMGSQIYLPKSRRSIMFESLKDDASAKKILGKSNKIVVFDEAQNARQDILKTAVEEYAEPSLMDNGGICFLIGSPPKVHSTSYFLQRHKKTKNSFDNINIYDNKFIPKFLADAFLKNKRKEKGFIKGKEDSNFQRQYLGKLIEDVDSLVFPLTEHHVYSKLPSILNKFDYYAAGGIDIGFNDKDAFAVLYYYPKARMFFLDYEFEKSEQLTKEFSRVISRKLEKHKNIIDIDLVGDSGGGGKKTIADMENDSDLFIEKAYKYNKLRNIKYLQNLIREKRFFVKKDSIFLKESSLIEWDENKEKIDNRVYHSDILDAILYALRYLVKNYC